jgi:hypothetical protein
MARSPGTAEQVLDQSPADPSTLRRWVDRQHAELALVLLTDLTPG